MAELIVMFKDALSFDNKRSIVIDSWEFKTSSQFTPALLVLASMIVTARQFFGQPIRCDPNVSKFMKLNKLLKLKETQVNFFRTEKLNIE